MPVRSSRRERRNLDRHLLIRIWVNVAGWIAVPPWVVPERRPVPEGIPTPAKSQAPTQPPIKTESWIAPAAPTEASAVKAATPAKETSAPSVKCAPGSHTAKTVKRSAGPGVRSQGRSNCTVGGPEGVPPAVSNGRMGCRHASAACSTGETSNAGSPSHARAVA